MSLQENCGFISAKAVTIYFFYLEIDEFAFKV